MDFADKHILIVLSCTCMYILQCRPNYFCTVRELNVNVHCSEARLPQQSHRNPEMTTPFLFPLIYLLIYVQVCFLAFPAVCTVNLFCVQQKLLCLKMYTCSQKNMGKEVNEFIFGAQLLFSAQFRYKYVSFKSVPLPTPTTQLEVANHCPSQ